MVPTEAYRDEGTSYHYAPASDYITVKNSDKVAAFMEQAGLPIVAHIHDEVVLEVPEGNVTVEEVCSIMNQNPSWAKGLPLSSAGYVGERFYFKD